MFYNKLKIDDWVYDKSMKEYGRVVDLNDIHNVHELYEHEGGAGLYCLDPDCEEFDNNLKLIK